MTIDRQYQTPYERDVDADNGADVHRDGALDADNGADSRAESWAGEFDQVQPDSVDGTPDSFGEGRGSLDETPDSTDEVPDPVVDPGGEDSRLDDTVVVGEPALVGQSVDVDSTAGTHAQPREWQSLQGRFVDDPDAAVSEAAALVEEAVRRLLDSLRDGTSAEAGDVSTEDKRVAFQRYRAVYELVTKG